MRHLRKLYEWWPLWVIPLVVTLAVWLPSDDSALADNTVGPTNQVLCNKQAMSIGTGATASTVTGVAGQLIYICGWHVTSSAASGTFQLSFGTGSTCTSGTNITPTLNVSNTAPSADHITAAWASSAPGQSLCVNATVTTTAIEVFYSQFP